MLSFASIIAPFAIRNGTSFSPSVDEAALRKECEHS
jgi:hypothetical protein